MTTKRQWIPIAGLAGVMAAAGVAVAQLAGQTPAPTGDFTKAAAAEVRDAQGQVVLRGQFAAPVEEDGGLERVAALASTGVDADASGEAEIEFAKTAATEQEIEFTVANLPPQASFTFVIDGTEVATATTDRQGRAEVELDVKIAAIAASR